MAQVFIWHGCTEKQAPESLPAESLAQYRVGMPVSTFGVDTSCACADDQRIKF